MKPLSGLRALVTGSSRGLGKGIALALAEAGARVAINYHRNEKEALAVKAEIEGLGGEALVIQADVSQGAPVAAMFRKIVDAWGGLDVLVNNAGTTKSQDIFETSEADWDFILDTNLKSVFLCSKEAMVLMRGQKRGRIVNISSIVAHRGALYGHVHYAATKGAILSFTRTLARTGAPHGILVNAIAPGIIESELLVETHGKEDVAALAASVPLGLGQARDVGLAAVYLAGEGGRYLTGATLDVNGGMHFH